MNHLTRINKIRRNETKRRVRSRATGNCFVGRERHYGPVGPMVKARPKGVIRHRKAAKAIGRIGPHWKFTGPRTVNKRYKNIKFWRDVIQPFEIEDYYPLHTLRGYYWGYIYDYNIYSADGSAWLAFFEWIKHWGSYVMYGLGGAPFNEGSLYNDRHIGAASGPNRRYLLTHFPLRPIRPPVPFHRAHIPAIPEYPDPESIWDIEFWSGRVERVGPGDAATYLSGGENDCISHPLAPREGDRHYPSAGMSGVFRE